MPAVPPLSPSSPFRNTGEAARSCLVMPFFPNACGGVSRRAILVLTARYAPRTLNHTCKLQSPINMSNVVTTNIGAPGVSRDLLSTPKHRSRCCYRPTTIYSSPLTCSQRAHATRLALRSSYGGLGSCCLRLLDAEANELIDALFTRARAGKEMVDSPRRAVPRV